MKFLLVDNESLNIEHLENYFKQKSHKYTLKKYNELSNFNEYDLVLLSGGSSFSIEHHSSGYLNEINLIYNSTTPIVGICLGFQLIVKTFNPDNHVTALLKEEKEIKNIKLIENNILFNGLESITVQENHKWCVKRVYDPLISLAQSMDGVEIIKHKTKFIYGFQFHPELSINKTEGHKLLDNFINILQINLNGY